VGLFGFSLVLRVVLGFFLWVYWAFLCILFVYLEALCAFFIYNT
jgi:hypothetical protein